MKKSSHLPKAQKQKSRGHSQEAIAPLEDAPLLDVPADDLDIATDQFAVVARQDEAASSGHRVEPIKIDPEEDNAETLIEEGLHGFRRASPNHTHRGK